MKTFKCPKCNIEFSEEDQETYTGSPVQYWRNDGMNSQHKCPYCNTSFTIKLQHIIDFCNDSRVKFVKKWVDDERAQTLLLYKTVKFHTCPIGVLVILDNSGSSFEDNIIGSFGTKNDALEFINEIGLTLVN